MNLRSSAACGVLAAALAACQPPAPEAGPVEVVNAFHEALKAGDRGRVLEILAPEVIVAEQGMLEASREEYAKEHLGADMSFSAGTSRTVLQQRTLESGGQAWVFSVSEVEGTFSEQPVSVTTNETMMLRRADGRWRIAHIHWSSRKNTQPEGN